MMGLLALLWLASSLALAPPAASRIRRRRVARGAGAFPEVEFASSPRQSLRGVWRLRRDCEEDETAIDDIIVTLKASGTFSSAYFPLVEPADEAVAAPAEVPGVSSPGYSDPSWTSAAMAAVPVLWAAPAYRRRVRRWLPVPALARALPAATSVFPAAATGARRDRVVSPLPDA